MKILITIIVFAFAFLNISAQDKRYTHDSENGFMWLDFEKRMIAKNVKYDFLSSMLENEKLKKLSNHYKDDLGCNNDLNKIQSIGSQIDLNEIVKMIDEFYLIEENLIMPIKYAYCYCIKTLAGRNSEELYLYRNKIISFSKSSLEK
jgi:hypothetical protein